VGTPILGLNSGGSGIGTCSQGFVIRAEGTPSVCRDLLDRLVTEPNFMTRVITADESWVFEYDPETKRQKFGMAHVNVTSPKKSSNEQIKNQINAHSFFYSRGIAHKEFVPPGPPVPQFICGCGWTADRVRV
jgi:hypothetical protein